MNTNLRRIAFFSSFLILFIFTAPGFAGKKRSKGGFTSGNNSNKTSAANGDTTQFFESEPYLDQLDPSLIETNVLDPDATQVLLPEVLSQSPHLSTSHLNQSAHFFLNKVFLLENGSKIRVIFHQNSSNFSLHGENTFQEHTEQHQSTSEPVEEILLDESQEYLIVRTTDNEFRVYETNSIITDSLFYYSIQTPSRIKEITNVSVIQNNQSASSELSLIYLAQDGVYLQRSRTHFGDQSPPPPQRIFATNRNQELTEKNILERRTIETKDGLYFQITLKNGDVFTINLTDPTLSFRGQEVNWRDSLHSHRTHNRITAYEAQRKINSTQIKVDILALNTQPKPSRLSQFFNFIFHIPQVTLKYKKQTLSLEGKLHRIFTSMKSPKGKEIAVLYAGDRFYIIDLDTAAITDTIPVQECASIDEFEMDSVDSGVINRDKIQALTSLSTGHKIAIYKTTQGELFLINQLRLSKNTSENNGESEADYSYRLHRINDLRVYY